jgi:CRP/FNR family cyclic AMP-dependent transcriptional regulator
MEKSWMVEYLSTHPLLKDFKPEHLEILETCAGTAEFKPGDYIYRERTKADRLYFIIKGRVAIELHAPRQEPWTIMTISEGGALGWAWALPPYQWYYSCRTVLDTRTVFLEADCLKARMKSDYELGYKLMTACAHVLEERLAATRLQLLNALSKD